MVLKTEEGPCPTPCGTGPLEAGKGKPDPNPQSPRGRPAQPRVRGHETNLGLLIPGSERIGVSQQLRERTQPKHTPSRQQTRPRTQRVIMRPYQALLRQALCYGLCFL